MIETVLITLAPFAAAAAALAAIDLRRWRSWRSHERRQEGGGRRAIPFGVEICCPGFSAMAECDGPCWHDCWEACDCGLFEQLNPHLTFTEGPTARNNSGPGPTTPKPAIVPKGQSAKPRRIGPWP